MTFYAAAFRHVPVNWIVGSMNIISAICGACGWTVERIWSFFTAIWYNICGFDKYFVFMDESPVPIPYLNFGGYPGSNCWLYDARNKVFYGCDNESQNKKEFLPVLSMELIWNKGGELVGCDMSAWLERLQIYTYNERFPHPLQILSAWSLDSYIWPATKKQSKTVLETISAQTGDTEYIHLYQEVCKHAWYDFDQNEEESDDADDEEEDEEQSKSSHEDDNDLHVSENSSEDVSSEETGVSEEVSSEETGVSEEVSSEETGVSEEGSSSDETSEKVSEPESDNSSFELNTESAYEQGAMGSEEESVPNEKPLPPSPQSD